MKKAAGSFAALSLIGAGILISACSLSYETQEEAGTTTPECVFSELVLHRYEDRQLSLELQAQTMEQYTDSASFAENNTFTTWNSDGTVDTTGTCQLLSAHTADKRYALFGGIQLHNADNALTIEAEALRYKGTSEQLTAAIGETVHLFKDDLELTGTGFSASGVSHTYQFSGPVQGTLLTSDPAEDTP